MYFIPVCISLNLGDFAAARRAQRGEAGRSLEPAASRGSCFRPLPIGSTPASERLNKVVLARGREPARGGERRLGQ